MMINIVREWVWQWVRVKEWEMLLFFFFFFTSMCFSLLQVGKNLQIRIQMQRLEKITWTWHKVWLKKETRDEAEKRGKKSLRYKKRVLTNNRRLTLSAAVRHKVRQALNPNTGFHFSLSVHTSFTLYLTAGRPSRSWLYVFELSFCPLFFSFFFFWKMKMYPI